MPAPTEREIALSQKIADLSKEVAEWETRAHMAEAAMVAMDAAMQTKTTTPVLHEAVVKAMLNLMPVAINAMGVRTRLMALDVLAEGKVVEVLGDWRPSFKEVSLRGPAQINDLLALLRGHDRHRGFRERLFLMNPMDLTTVVQVFARARTDEQLADQLRDIGRVELTRRPD